MKMEWYSCDGCGKREKLEAGKRHWCKCHPAGFVMVSDWTRRMSERAVRAFRGMTR